MKQVAHKQADQFIAVCNECMMNKEDLREYWLDSVGHNGISRIGNTKSAWCLYHLGPRYTDQHKYRILFPALNHFSFQFTLFTAYLQYTIPLLWVINSPFPSFYLHTFNTTITAWCWQQFDVSKIIDRHRSRGTPIHYWIQCILFP